MRVLVAALPLLAVACGLSPRPPTVDPEANFAAYRVRGGFAIDRIPGGSAGRLRPAALLRRPGAPTFVLEADGERRAALWVRSPSRVVVREGRSDDGRVAGEVTAAWEDGAVRVAFTPADTTRTRSIVSEAFAREGGGTGPPVLTRTVSTVLDVRGTYRAPLHAPDGAAVGWLRVRASPYAEAPRRYEAVLPAGLPVGLAAAAVVLLDGEIDWIEDHTVNVYRSSGADGGLDQSIRMPR